MSSNLAAKVQIAVGIAIFAPGLALGGWGVMEMTDSYDIEMFYLMTWFVMPSLLPIIVGLIVLVAGLSKVKRLRIDPQ